MRKLKIAALLVGAALTALLAVGCGSSDDSTTGGSDEGSLTKAEFITKADSICAASEKQGEAEVEEFIEEQGLKKGEEPSKELQEQLANEVVLPNISGQLEEIRTLGFPEGNDGEAAEEVIDSAEEDVEEAESDPSVLFSSNSFDETNKQAREYGLKECGS